MEYNNISNIPKTQQPAINPINTDVKKNQIESVKIQPTSTISTITKLTCNVYEHNNTNFKLGCTYN